MAEQVHGKFSGESVTVTTGNVLQQAETEPKLDMGPQKDHWMELYGNSVLNNTLQVTWRNCKGIASLGCLGENRAAPAEEESVCGVEQSQLWQGRPG